MNVMKCMLKVRPLNTNKKNVSFLKKILYSLFWLGMSQFMTIGISMIDLRYYPTTKPAI